MKSCWLNRALKQRPGVGRQSRGVLIHDKHEIVVNGGKLMKELGFKPGPDLGRTLKAIENAIVDGKLANDEESIMAFVQAMKQV